jgi:single-strand DNA-binding protein
MYDTAITMVGHVASDPVLRVTGNGTKVVSFRLASTARRRDPVQGDWVDGDTLFFTVKAWKATADNVVASLRKGDPVVVHGRVRDDSYDDKEGMRRTAYVIEAFALGHNLARGLTRFVKRTGDGARPAVNAPAVVDAAATGPVPAEERGTAAA